jgi:hypothetical protein
MEQTMTNEVQDVQNKNEQPTENQKNVINYNPVFPTLTCTVETDLDFEETLQDIYKLASDTVNSPIGYSTLGQDPNAVKKLAGGENIEGAIYGIATNFMKELRSEIDEEKCFLRTWLNVTRLKNHQPRISHPNAQLAGMVVISTGEKPTPFLLHNPTSAFRSHEVPPMKVSDYTAFTAPSVVLEAKAGTVFMWPAWMQYEIPETTVGGPFIFVGFTIDFLPRGM